jgi:hypothetical protein
MNTTIINCPACERGLQLPVSLFGQQVQCPTCGHTFTGSANGHSGSAGNYSEHDHDDVASWHAPPSAPPDTDEDYHGGAPEQRIRPKPGKVQAISIMMLVGGIYALVHALGGVAASGLACCVWPGLY